MNLVGYHARVNVDPLGRNIPKGMMLIATIHTHPPDPNPRAANPANSEFDPQNSNLPPALALGCRGLLAPIVRPIYWEALRGGPSNTTAR